MSTLIQPKRQIAAAVESVEGSAESLSAANAKHRVLDQDLVFSEDIQVTQRNIVQASLSKHTSLIGVELAGITCSIELRGSGSIASPSGDYPSWDPMIRACGFQRTAVKKLAVGAITGTFVHGETVTGGTSNATGRVISRWTGSDGQVVVEVLTGTFQSAETLTGGTSGATATTSATAAAGGWAYEPASSDVPSLTMAMYHDGVKKLLVGARGNVRLEGSVGEAAMLRFDFTGVYGGVTDVSMLTGISYETTVPPVMKNATLKFDSFAPVVTSFSFDTGNVVAPRRSIAAAAGAVSARITDRVPTATMDPEMDLVANFDFYGKKKGGTLHYTELAVGSTAGNRFKICVPQTQIVSVAPGDRDRLSTVQLGLELKGNDSYQDGEICILSY